MPTTQGPVVIQSAPRVGILNQALGAAGAELLGGVARAAGGFLGDMIHQDPKDAVYQAQADATRAKIGNDALNAYQAFLAERGTPNDAASRAAFAKLHGLSAEQEEAFEPLAASSTFDTQLRQQGGAALMQGINPTAGPFSAGGGLSATVPPPGLPSQEQAISQATLPQQTPVPVGTGKDAQGASAAGSQKALQVEATSPVTAPVTPQSELKTLPVEDETTKPVAPLPPPLTPQQMQEKQVGAMQAVQRIKGALAQLGQMRIAGTTGAVDPGQSALAVSLVNTTEDDINHLIQVGKVVQGIDPTSGVNYADLAFKRRAYEDLNDPASVDALTKAGKLDTYKALANDWQQVAASGKLSTTDLGMIAKVQEMVAPSKMGNTAWLQYLGVKGAQENDSKRIQNETSTTQHNIEMSTDANRRANEMLQYQTGLAAEQIAGLSAERRMKLEREPLLQAGLAADVSAKRQQIQMEAQAMGYKLTAMQLNNLSVTQAITDRDTDRALQLAGIMQNTTQHKVGMIQSSLKQNEVDLQKLDATVGTEAKSFVRTQLNDYAQNPKRLEADIKKSGKVEQVEFLAKEIAGTHHAPSQTERAQALVAMNNPTYMDYVKRASLYQQNIELANIKLVELAKKDSEWGPKLQEAMKILGKSPEGKTQFDSIMNQYLTGNVLATSRQVADANVRGKSTEEASNFLRNNPEYINHMLGQVQVENGQVKYLNHGIMPDQSVGLFQLSRTTPTALSQQQFESMAIPASETSPATTMKAKFGKNVKAAYNNYLTFHRVGR